MAPKKNTKRAQEAKVASSAAKKQKVDAKYTPIIKGIEQASGLSKSCRQMLLAAVPHSLGTPSDLRSEAHHTFVRMIGEALDDVQVKLQQAVDEQTAAVQEAENSKSSLMLKLAEEKEALAKSDEIVQSKQSALDEKSVLLSEANAAMLEKTEAQRAGHAAFDNANKQKASLEEAIQTNWKPIYDGDCTEDDANAHFKSLESFFNELNLDDSLKTASPVTCVKPKAQRGAFDDLVIEQIQKAFTVKVTDFSGLFDEAGTKKAELDAAAEAADAIVKDADAQSQAAASELASAQASMQEASDAVKMAESNVAAHEQELLNVTGQKETMAAVLNEFVQYNKGNFELLKDQVSKTAAVPEDHAEMQDGESNVERISAKLDAIEGEIGTQVPVAVEVGGA